MSSDQFSPGSKSLEPTAAPRLGLDLPTGPRPESLGSYGYGVAAAVPAESDPMYYLKVLHKRRWIVLTAFCLITGGVALHLATVERIYEAKTRLLIESDEKNVVAFKQVVEEETGNQDYYQTQYNILQSRALARRTLDATRLWNTPPFGGDVQQTFSLTRTILDAPSALIAGVAGLFGSSEAPPAEAPGENETRAQSRSIDVFLGRLVVTPVRNSRLVDLTYRSTDPVLATTIINMMAKTYIEQNLEYKFLASKEASGWLGERLAEQRAEVEKAELALQRYRETNDAVAAEDRGNIVSQRLADLAGAVTKARMERLSKEGAYNQLRDAQDNPAALDTFPAIMTNGFIQQQRGELAAMNAQLSQLSEKFGEKHPQIAALQRQIKGAQAKLQGEILKVVESVRNEYLAAAAQENGLTAALNQQKGEAQSMNRKSIEYGVLARDVESSRQIYESLLNRAKETGVSGELRTSNIRVLDPAEQPRRPATPKVGQTTLLGLVGGAFVGIALAFLLEFLDNRIKSPNEIKTHLGLPVLGYLPLVAKQAGTGSPLLGKGAPDIFNEAFRGIRTNVVFSSAEQGAKSIVVTSTGPGEGKTVVATNLAVALAQAGERVVLVDGDMRRPQVHKSFGIRLEPGLSNLMVGNSKATDAVRTSEFPGLWVVTGGRIPPNPAEILGSTRFQDFLTSLSEHFDWIVIDSPPVMAVTDAAILAHNASGVLFVVRADATSRHTAQAALNQLDASQAKFYGGVVNGLDLDRNGYYYSQFYKPEYGAYYTSATRTGT